MIPKRGYRFSEKIMLNQQAKAKGRFNLKPFRFSLAGFATHNAKRCG
jgi:DNA-binding winged helix-turn-helix (wHTH) protein